MRTPRFWITSACAAVAASIGWALVVPLVAWLEPRAGLRSPSGTDLWLLGVFTAGVLALLLGLSVVVGGRLPGARAKAALLRMLAPGDSGELSDDASDAAGSVAGWWTVAVGVELLAIYLVGWIGGS